jgi:hypothetical protein
MHDDQDGGGHDDGEGDGELTDTEREALQALRATPPLPADLAARLVSTLRERGELRGGAAARRWRILATAAAALLAGFLIGRLSDPSPTEPAARDGERYLLLLKATGRLVSDAEERGLVAEYGAWASRLRREGVVISGEKLDDQRTLLTADQRRADVGPTAGALAGYFLVGASNERHALAVAASCPHLRHGGEIEVRRIATLPAGG